MNSIELAAFYEKYRQQNPVKYARKEAYFNQRIRQLQIAEGLIPAEPVTPESLHALTVKKEVTPPPAEEIKVNAANKPKANRTRKTAS